MGKILGVSVFILVFSLMVFGMQYFVIAGIAKLFGLKLTKRAAFVLITVTIGFIGSHILIRANFNFFSQVLYIVYYIYIGAVFLSFFYFLIYGFLHRFAGIGGGAVSRVVYIALISGLMVYGLIAARILKVKEIELSSDKIKNEVHLVQISDIHLGPVNRGNFLKRITDKVKELNPDILFITGDLFDGMDDIPVETLKLIEEIPGERYFILGNHETYGRMDEMLRKLSQVDIRILRNESVISGELQIIGIDDKHYLKLSVRDVLSGLELRDDLYSIFLTHQPVDLEKLNDFPIDLELAGHTHAGQLIPFNLFLFLVHPYRWGLYEVGDRHAYVSSGTGTWGPPLRIGSFNEITSIRLKPERTN